MVLKNDHLIQTRFDTPNYFTGLSESQVKLESYLGTENYNLYAYHFLFIKDDGEILDNKLDTIKQLSKEVSNSNISGQYLVVYYLSDFSLIIFKRTTMKIMSIQMIILLNLTFVHQVQF